MKVICHNSDNKYNTIHRCIKPSYSQIGFIHYNSSPADQRDVYHVQFDEDSHPAEKEAEKNFSHQSNTAKRRRSLGGVMIPLSVFYFLPVLCMFVLYTMNLNALHSSGSCELYLEYPFSY